VLLKILPWMSAAIMQIQYVLLWYLPTIVPLVSSSVVFIYYPCEPVLGVFHDPLMYVNQGGNRPLVVHAGPSLTSSG
jgi:hypothetical protein